MYTSTVGVPVKTKTLVELLDFLRANHSASDPADAIELAIQYWMSNAAWKKDDLIPGRSPQARGFQWKNVLLPPGTKVRMKYKGETYHGDVEGDDFLRDGRKTTPSEFANTIAGGTARNAWRDLWIKRPADREFRLADELRRAAE